jgi:hypothetical protein
MESLINTKKTLIEQKADVEYYFSKNQKEKEDYIAIEIGIDIKRKEVKDLSAKVNEIRGKHTLSKDNTSLQLFKKAIAADYAGYIDDYTNEFLQPFRLKTIKTKTKELFSIFLKGNVVNPDDKETKKLFADCLEVLTQAYIDEKK